MKPVFAISRKPASFTPWDFLALSDAEFERADIVAMNLSVARGIDSLKNLDVEHYTHIVDGWTSEFARRLPASEEVFWRAPEKCRNDIRLYRVGMLSMFLGSVIGIRYKEEEKNATAVAYTNPSDLFLNGIIDSKIGTCANMTALHVAMARRMGWPVSIALAKNHQVSRYDDGEVVYNIDAAKAEPDGFWEGPDEDYIQRMPLPRKGVECGADLRKLTAREMMGVFIWCRARHYQDVMAVERCDIECCLARHLLPKHRALYTMAMGPYLERGTALFDPHEEIGHPERLYEELSRIYQHKPPTPSKGVAPVRLVYEAAPKKQRTATIITIPLESLPPQRRNGPNISLKKG